MAKAREKVKTELSGEIANERILREASEKALWSEAGRTSQNASEANKNKIYVIEASALLEHEYLKISKDLPEGRKPDFWKLRETAPPAIFKEVEAKLRIGVEGVETPVWWEEFKQHLTQFNIADVMRKTAYNQDTETQDRVKGAFRIFLHPTDAPGILYRIMLTGMNHALSTAPKVAPPLPEGISALPEVTDGRAKGFMMYPAKSEKEQEKAKAKRAWKEASENGAASASTADTSGGHEDRKRQKQQAGGKAGGSGKGKKGKDKGKGGGKSKGKSGKGGSKKGDW